jgi:hypothetical protein
MTMSPAERAIGIAAAVTAAALAVYSVAATLDRWPDLVIAAWGGALGAGMAINGIALREMDVESDRVADTPSSRHWFAAAHHQICTALVAVAAWQTAAAESFAWAAATVVLGVAWAWTITRLVSTLERAGPRDALHAFYRAFRAAAITLAVAAMYASVALESTWLWRPSAPADLQGFVWLAVLEFAGLPATLMAFSVRPSSFRS